PEGVAGRAILGQREGIGHAELATDRLGLVTLVAREQHGVVGVVGVLDHAHAAAADRAGSFVRGRLVLDELVVGQLGEQRVWLIHWGSLLMQRPVLLGRARMDMAPAAADRGTAKCPLGAGYVVRIVR